MKKWASLLVVAAIFLAAPNLWAQCAVVGTATATWNTGGNTVLSYSATGGNTITISAVGNAYGTPGPSITDNKGSVYVQDNYSFADSDGCTLFRYHLFNASPGITTITLHGGGDGGAFTVTEFSGGTNTGDVKVALAATPASTAGFVTPLSGTLAQANEIVFGDVAQCSADTYSAGPTNNYTPVVSGFVSGSNTTRLGSAYLIAAATTSTNTKYTIVGSKSFSAITDSYECNAPAGGGGGGRVIPLVATASTPSPDEVMSEADE